MSSSVNEQEKRNPSNTTSVFHNKKGLKGKEEALGNNVFGYGHVAQAELYNKTVEELAEYVGKNYSKEMRALVNTGEDGEPEEPDPPKDKNSVSDNLGY